MTDSETPSAELRELCAAAVEGRLSTTDTARLEELVLTDAAARRYYASFVGLHAALAWSAADPTTLVGTPRQPAVPRSAFRVSHSAMKWAIAAGIVFTILGTIVGWALRPQELATLVGVGSCKWDSGTLPTEEGARLTAGRLRLAEGVARIQFDLGAEVRMEGPAELELLSGSRCVLHSGRLVAKVPPRAIGFVVDTPAAELTDYGTEFGVHVRDGQTSDVQVFEGIVEGKHRDTGSVKRMLTGQNQRFAQDGVAAFDPQAEQPPTAPHSPAGTETLTITTAMGSGKDAYAAAVVNTPHISDVLTLVKSSVSPGGKVPFNRKGYAGFDLASLAGRRVVDAQLTLTLAPTGMGFASEVPDTTFTVYGLTEESLDGWNEKGLTWENAPANVTVNGSALDPERVVNLGSFSVAQGVFSGTRSVSGPGIAAFLNRDTNGLATFIVVRNTVGSGRSDLVHGFANKRHPTLPPPTLKLTVK